MHTFYGWLESLDTWAHVPYTPGELMSTDELYRQQSVANKKIMERQKVEDERYLGNLADSIALHGMKQPIVVNAKGEITDGLHRLIVARGLGMPEVPLKRATAVGSPSRTPGRTAPTG